MLAIERRNEILEKLQTDRRVVVSELSQIYEVSEETIRRDLDKLVIKSYGGAVINENMNIDLPFNIRKNRNVIGKQRIAELVAKIVQDGDSIMLDASSTAVYIAKGLKDKKNLTLITNGNCNRAFGYVRLEGIIYRRSIKRGIVCSCGNPDEPDAPVVSCRQSNYFVQRPGYGSRTYRF